MNKLFLLFILCLMCTGCRSPAAESWNDLAPARRAALVETEKIINMILNSPEFDSLYKERPVYLREGNVSPYLKYQIGGVPVKIVSKSEIQKKELHAINFSEFSMDPANPVKGFTYIEVFDNGSMSLIIIYFRKIGDGWVIRDSGITRNYSKW